MLQLMGNLECVAVSY